MAIEERKGTNYSLPSPGPYLAKIVSHLDPTYMGTLEVELMHESGNDTDSTGQLHQVKYLSPFAGQTSIRHIDEGDEDYNNTQKSYGMWMIPPDIGGIVVVIFIDGDPRKGYWIGCAQDQYMNFMMPGYAATSFATSKETDKVRVPVAEYNKIKNDSSVDPTKFKKPATPFEGTLDTQGLLQDDIRGITTSSARREIPSAVFGISTPGPIDKKGKRGKIGKKESPIDQAYISRLGGSSFVMDDGDDKFIRKTTATDGPPEYAAVEQGETDGQKEIPHNELIRIRTRTGHQILLHNSEDLIYIGNARGTAWIELTSDGKMDIYTEDSITMHTKTDFNVLADRDINLEAKRNFNLKVGGSMQTEVTKDQVLIVDGKQNLHIKQDVNVTLGAKLTKHVVGNIDIQNDANYKTLTKGSTDSVTNGSSKSLVKGSLDSSINGTTKIKVGGSFNLLTTGSNNFTASGSTNIKSGGSHIESAGVIHMNGPGAASAAGAAAPAEAALAVLPPKLKVNILPNEIGNPEIDSILRRVPTHEPWPHHENLDPKMFKREKLDRDLDGRTNTVNQTDGAYSDLETKTLSEPAPAWSKYSTATDTFAKVSGADE
jgi:hypothetical protein